MSAASDRWAEERKAATDAYWRNVQPRPARKRTRFKPLRRTVDQLLGRKSRGVRRSRGVGTLSLRTRAGSPGWFRPPIEKGDSYASSDSDNTA